MIMDNVLSSNLVGSDIRNGDIYAIDNALHVL